MDTPECDKLVAIGPQKCAVENFLEYLSERGIRLAEYREREWAMTPVIVSSADLVSDFFGIDAAALERERRGLLEEARRLAEERACFT